MQFIAQYVLRITAAAAICAVLKSLLPGKDTASALLRMISGIFLAFTVIQPIRSVSLQDLPSITESYIASAEAVAGEGQQIAWEAMADIIMEQTRAYILDKAHQLGAELSVRVSLCEDTGIPESVQLSGVIPPYAKLQLQRFIAKELGISEENQIWIE